MFDIHPTSRKAQPDRMTKLCQELDYSIEAEYNQPYDEEVLERRLFIGHSFEKASKRI